MNIEDRFSSYITELLNRNTSDFHKASTTRAFNHNSDTFDESDHYSNHAIEHNPLIKGFSQSTVREKILGTVELKLPPSSNRSTSAQAAIASAAPHGFSTAPTQRYSDPINIATFNTYGYKNVNVDAQVNSLIQDNDIVGLQEPAFDELIRYAAANRHTHGVILGLENSGGEYAPIIFNKNRFDAVHTSSIRLPGGKRTATFAVLRDKTTGALTVVGNTHLSASNAIADRRANLEFAERLVQDLVTRFGAEGSVLMGDFNMGVPHEGGSYSSASLPTFERGGNIDGVLVYETDAIASNPVVTDGGASDHNAVSREVRFKYDPTESSDHFDLPKVGFSRLNLIIHQGQEYHRKDEYKLEDAYGLTSSRSRTGRAAVNTSPHRRHDLIRDTPISSSPPRTRSGRGVYGSSSSNHRKTPPRGGR